MDSLSRSFLEDSDATDNDVGGPTTVPGARKGVTLPLLVISGWATGPPAGVGDGLDSSPRADNTSVRAGGDLSVGTPQCSDLSRQYGAVVHIMETQVKALTTLLPALGAFCLCEFRVFSTNLNILRSICSGHGDPARRAAATAAPDGSPRSYPRPTPPAASGQ